MVGVPVTPQSDSLLEGQMKKCGRCYTNKDLSEFGTRTRNHDEPRSYCHLCVSETDRIRNHNNKLLAFEHYGGSRCSCCGVSEISFLSLDHADNNGTELRKIHGNGNSFYRWLKRMNYPESLNLRVLCHNCNHGREINGGVCPHKISKRV